MNDSNGRKNRRLTRRELLLALGGGAAAACGRTRIAQTPPPRMPGPLARLRRRELIVCGGEDVFVLSLRVGAQPDAETVWSWSAADCPNLPEAMHAKFRTTDECKPADRGRRILVTASSDGVALIERATGRALFRATVTNAHSAEVLPRDRIVVAASVSESPTGNRLVLFDADAPDKELFSDTFESAHGVVWDGEREILWALGYKTLRAYRLRDWDSPSPRLERHANYALPDTGGHDLAPVPRTSLLFVSTGRRCWFFDRRTRWFLPHDVLPNAPRVKSYSLHPATGQVAYVQAEGENWWAQRVHLLRPAAEIHLPGERLYKARWNAPT